MRSRRTRLGAVGVFVILAIIVGTMVSMLTPVMAPQATCDALAPILGCEGGATPSCGVIQQRKGQSVRVTCPEGGGSAIPIYLVAGGISLLLPAIGLPFLVFRARRQQRAAQAQVQVHFRSW